MMTTRADFGAVGFPRTCRAGLPVAFACCAMYALLPSGARPNLFGSD